MDTIQRPIEFLTSYHVHSKWSDGEGSIADLIAAAGRCGLDEVGISDHYVLTSDRRDFVWSMPVDELDRYVEEVQSASGEAGENLIVRLGIEADHIPETAAEMAAALSSQPFDYVIGSVHFIDGFPVDENTDNWRKLSQSEVDEHIRRYWRLVADMADSGLYDIAAHLDLTKKFGIYPSIDLSTEIGAALDAIRRAGMTVELNTAGWFAVAAEQYPSAGILKGCLDRGIPLMVNADTHSTENLMRAFDRAYRMLRDMGCAEVASYAGRMRVMRPI